MNKGFVALVIVLSVSGMLLALVAANAIESATFFDEALRKEYRFMNYYYASDCINQAILGLAHDYFLSASIPTSLPYFHCSILSITADGDLRMISTRGDYQKAYVYRSAIVRIRIHDLEVVKIE